MKPLLYQWDGECMRPLGRFARLADQQFVVGQNYRMDTIEERSAESHRHFFACVEQAWLNVPEIHAGRWATPDHLRKWALIQAGFRKETTFVASSKAEAIRLAGYLQTLDEYAVIAVDGRVVTRATAKSQSIREMPRKEFQDSKQAVLDVLADLIGVDPTQLATEAKHAEVAG